ncbi:organic hydroperoxide resistance protein [Actinomadura madurae]|uniref:organic hydroperoxide resistance protein n=1 Tax=Actinomadura madurae TaxID=1993 RepID=UPI0020265F97|nr:organic hydroperoxide resistance protein [Actinomadura madurae]MCP9953129.1 organic hydroperoxide resistance protein [Actinomadura madurae]MCP9969896.1 organic hydroperoxide resistance protein [Actinomadura madurae]MCP9982343.1 organic hydroperoxide resistance protein [Actinomadura madurae]MCQ0018592.1 organic hydroperoxide resistance protein [Actinomadura madurae]URM98605.1 organic hydroperoxide resistance protein [Actinomadura madurae]
MTAPLYTAEAQVTGGRNGRGRTSDGRLDLDLRLPKELGGDGEGANPEQLFAVGYAACFGTVLAMVGQRENLKADDARIDASVSLIPAGGGRFKLGAHLRISLPSVTDEQAIDLVKAAHQACPYSNATRGNIDVALQVNGTDL